MCKTVSRNIYIPLVLPLCILNFLNLAESLKINFLILFMIG